MADMIGRQILPAVSSFTSDLASCAAVKKECGVPCRYDEKTAKDAGQLTDALFDAAEQLEKDLLLIPEDPDEAMFFSRDVLIPDMQAAREAADALEKITAREYWPFPVYADLLFSET